MKHDHIVNASIQVVPIVQDRHPYLWVDEAITIIQSSKIKYEVGPFATVIEGTYQQVLDVINSINEHLRLRGCAEWLVNIQLQVRSESDITADEKTVRYQQ